MGWSVPAEGMQGAMGRAEVLARDEAPAVPHVRAQAQRSAAVACAAGESWGGLEREGEGRVSRAGGRERELADSEDCAGKVRQLTAKATRCGLSGFVAMDSRWMYGEE